MIDRRAVAVEKIGVLIDEMIPRALELLQESKSIAGVGAIMKEDQEITPMHFHDPSDPGPMKPAFFKRIFNLLKDQVSSGKAICAGLVHDGQIYLDGNTYDSMIIHLFHQELEGEFISYVIPYVLMKGNSLQDPPEIVLLQESAHLEFINFSV